MERLTFEGNFCDIAKCEDTPGGSFCEYGYCDRRRVWERLKSIEDVIADENGKYDFEELATLVQAESEGRVDIHPCTEGTAVYVIREVRNHYLEPYHYEIQVMAYKKYMLKNYGKTVFLEKGAAKAALAAKEGEHE